MTLVTSDRAKTPRGPHGRTLKRPKRPARPRNHAGEESGRRSPNHFGRHRLLITASICGTLIVPIYARITPKIGDWPFFYFYLIAYIPVAAIIIWIVTLLQRRLQPPAQRAGGAVDGAAR